MRLLAPPVFADSFSGMGRQHTVHRRSRHRVGGEFLRCRWEDVHTQKEASLGYVVFHHCGRRQRRALATGDPIELPGGVKAFAFTCYKCHLKVPVKPPIELLNVPEEE